MRKEILDLLKEEIYVVNDIKTLADYGNERVYNIICDFNIFIDERINNEVESSYKIEQKRFEKLANKLKEVCESYSGDYCVTLEASFCTNNHYIFTVSELKWEDAEPMIGVTITFEYE